MIFFRFSLSYAINKAKHVNNISVYSELLKVFYRLVEQEQINNSSIINEFFYYEPLTVDALTFYLNESQKLINH